MQKTKYTRKQSAKRDAFTLVELLVVIVIIGILASLALYAVNGTYTAAKESKTRGTISKLNTAIMEIYEGYQDKFDNILSYSNYDDSLDDPANASKKAQLKLHLIHDLMRMEMPSYWQELCAMSDAVPPNIANVKPISITLSGSPFHINSVPPVCQFYISEANRINTFNPTDLDRFNSGTAELLFLIIANLNPGALENFHGSEIGINKNGCNVFLDAWGNPISFLRAAPGYTGAIVPIQPDIVRLSRGTLDQIVPENLKEADWDNIDGWWRGADANLPEAYQTAIREYADPFDPDGIYQRTWILYPLIISAGADGKADMYCPDITPTTPDTLSPFNLPTGMPKDNDGDGVLNHHDNITNHKWNNSF
ncbi:MAG: type II secretion system GspH family protein [Planctomycetaceae bacterium]|nr:type II secretion system GspH family protein [Planctomycetaceae bacterium]